MGGVDHERFDDLAHALATGQLTRGQVLRSLAASAVVSVLPFLGDRRAEAATTCKPVDKRCSNGGQCCSGICAGGLCRCKAVGKTCAANRQCCSGICAGGQCRCKANGKSCSSNRQCCSGNCENGFCTPKPLCGTDQMTSASLDAASTALANGATDVALSPGGCFRYRRTLTNGQVTHEEMTVNNKVMLTWDYTTTPAVMQRDANLDGFFEWRAEIDVSAGVDKVVEVATERSPSNQALISRETYTRNGDTVHVLLEEANSAGTLRTVGEYDTPLFVSASSDDAASDGAGPQASLAATGCTASEEALLRTRMKEAYDQGIHCLARKLPHTALDLARLRIEHEILLVCASLGTASNGQAILAQTQWLRVFKLFFIGNSEMRFDPSFFSAAEQTQRKVMFHELLHLHFGDHENKSVELNSPRRDETDRIYSCASMCFDASPNKCSCASCLGTNVCDWRCVLYQGCSNTNLGAICPCEEGSNAFKWFPTCSQCLSTCPSGLACFGISTCIPLDVSCSKTPVTCP